MPVFAQFNLDDVGAYAADSAATAGLQNGTYINGAASVGGQAVLDGVNDIIKIYPNPIYQLDRGTLDINFSLASDPLTATQTVLSRDTAGLTDGGYHIDILENGAVVISHETATGTETFGTEPGFAHPGDTINLSYSWDQGGAGGVLVINNTTTSTEFNEAVPNTLTMDMGASNQPWIIGAGQSNSSPDILNNIDQHFHGSVDMFQISDTVDNLFAPEANPDVATTSEDTAVIIPVLGNDSDPNGDPLTVTAATAQHGTVVINADGTLQYTPDANYNGPDSISYTVTDPAGHADSSTVAVTVTPLNDAPEAVDDGSTTSFDTPVTFAVMGNDRDVDGDPLAIVGAPTSADGTVLVNGDGSLTFTPNAGFTGAAVVNYTITDPEGLTDTASWTITVVDDQSPTANPDAATTPEDTPITITVLANDTDPNGDPLTVTAATAQHGTVAINPDGTLLYTPDANYNGPDSISYTVTDPAGHADSTTVAVTVTAANDAPVAGDDAATTPLNTAVIIPVLANDRDVDGDTLRVLGTPTSANGTVAVNPDGTLTFTPTTGFSGVATIDYTITDPTGLTDSAQVLVTVEGPVRDGIVSGTAGDDLIDVAYTGDPDGDRVDAADAILAGAAPNDDRIVAGAGNDTVLAGLGNDLVYGGNGNDQLSGDAGNDTLFGGAGNDLGFGGAGNDVIDTRGGGANPLPDQGYPGLYASDANPLNDLDTVYGGDGDDTILTGDDADLIYGGAGNDVVDTGFDDDSVYGGLGNDVIVGAEGNDLIDAGAGDDLVYGGYGPDVPDAVNIPDTDGDLLPSNGRDLIFGGVGNDTIFGQDDDDTINGGQDNDLVYGGVDEDLITGGAGSDTLHGDQGNDTLFGDQGNDLLFGGDGNDLIDGGEGNDTLLGGEGVDAAYGGDDRDTFVIDAPQTGLGDVVDGGEGGDDYDTLDLRGSGPFRITYAGDNPENGTVNFLDGDGNSTGTLTFRNIENVIPCFTPGTLIATPKGEIPVEELKAGDRVITRDNGIQQIRWTGRKDMGWHDLVANPHLKPVQILQGSLGNGLPERDMMVSPNHRVLVANDRTALYFDEHEVLVSAKHLVSSQGISAINAVGASYIHFMFERHEVVLSNGAWTESFQPGDYTLKGMGNAQRAEIFELFPELQTQAGLSDYQAARRTLKRHEAKLLIK